MSIFSDNNNSQNFPLKESKQGKSLISPFTTVEGKIIANENITIGGTFLGIIKIAGKLHILEQANIEGEVEATNIVVEGNVKGKVIANEKIELTKTAQVKADIEAKIIAVEAGAVLEGKCEMGNVKKSIEKQNEEEELR